MNTVPVNYHHETSAAIDPSDRQPPIPDDLDLPNLWQVIKAHLPAFLLTAALVLGAGLLFALLYTPKFSSTGIIDVADSTAAAIQSISQEVDPAAGNKDAALLQSERMAILVLNALHPEQTPTSQEIKKFLDRLKVSQEKDTTIIRITYKDPSAAQAAHIVNLLIEQFKAFKRQYLSDLIQQEKQYIDRELQTRRTVVLAAEKAVDDFKAKNGLTDNLGVTVKAQQISTLNTQLLLAQVENQKAQSRLRQIEALERSGNTTAIGTLSNSPLVQRLREQQAELRARIRELQDEYGPKHPKLIDARSQLAEVKRDITSEIKFLSDQVRSDAALEQERVQTLRAAISRLETEVATAQSSVATLRELQREADSSRQIYEALLSRDKNLSATSEDLILSKLVTIISKGYEAAEPEFPKQSQILYLSLVAAAILGLMAVFLAEQFNPKIAARRAPEPIQADQKDNPLSPNPMVKTAAMIEPETEPVPDSRQSMAASAQTLLQPEKKVPTVAPELDIPIPGDGSGIVAASEVINRPQSMFALSMQRLNRSLNTRLRRIPEPHAVLITANHSTGDKLSVAAALATLNAAEHRKVIVVDLSHGETPVHRAFGLQSTPGITEVLATSVTLLSAIQTDPKTGISLFAAGKPMDEEMTLKLIEDTPSLVALLKKYFDLVILVTRNLDIALTDELTTQGVSQTLVVISPSETFPTENAEVILSNPKLAKHAGKLLHVNIRRSV
ncbi:MAG: exopolysaccharide transport family protein [Thiotrichales bacterium]